ncbi:MAG: AAA family ATPase [Clostridiales bacterium]|jgi:chromosome partitioning protein|nr:AAA family ATPase [Eubacteriales bacterium]MDH7567656.1 AAA family ATPase [Clostridiales bacterium]
MITISIVNQKGGCSKTSTAVNLSSVLAEKGHKTLLIDMDPQGNASSSLGIDNFNSPTIYEVLHGEIPIDSAVLETGIVNLYMIASNILTAKLEREMSRNSGSEENLSEDLKPTGLAFDTIIRVSQAIPKAQANKQPVNIYQENSRGSHDYKCLANEIINKLGKDERRGC